MEEKEYDETIVHTHYTALQVATNHRCYSMNFDILAEWIQIYLCTDEPREKK
jgi:hypothetical protein